MEFLSGLIASETLAERLKRADANFSAQRHRALPSGLTPEEVVELADALLNTLRRTRQTAQNLTPNDITLKQQGQKIAVEIPDGQLAQDALLEQKALAELLYNLLTGQSAAQPLTYIRFKESYAATLAVIENGQAAKYSSIGELVGAFGWSLYQQQFYTDSLKQAPRSKKLPFSFLGQPGKKLLSAIPTTKAFFPIWLIVPFVGLVVFVVFAALNTPAFDATATKPTATPQTATTPTLTTTLTSLEISTGSDGSQTTRYNPAQNPTTELFQYKAPKELKAGQVADLSGGRMLNATSIQLSASQSLLYLSLLDGGWEVWDMLSQKRISRREVPNSDSYVQISWSPNGENFAALGLDGQVRFGSQGQVKRVVPYINPDNGANYTWQLAAGNPLFSWSPNSNYLLVRTEYGTLQLWGFWDGIKRLAGEEETSAKSQSFAATAFGNTEWFWSADSRYLAGYSQRSSQLDVFDTSTQRKVYSVNLSVADNSNLEFIYAVSLNNLHSWSPDGRFIALTTWQASPGNNNPNNLVGNSNLQILELPEQLPNDGRTIKPLGSQVITLATSVFYIPNVQLDWSRDNRLLVLRPGYISSAKPNEKPSSYLDVYSRETTGWQVSNRYNLSERFGSEFFSGKWHPDGLRVILNSRSGWLGICTIPLTSEAGKNLEAGQVFNPGITNQFLLPTVSPNNQWLTYLAKNGNLELKELATGKITYSEPLSGSFNKFYWSPDSKWLAANTNYRQDAPTTPTIAIWQVENGKLKVYGEIFPPNSVYSTIDWDTKNAKPTLLMEAFAGLIIAWDLTSPPPPLQEQQTQWNQVKTGVRSAQNSFNEVDISQVKLPFQLVTTFPADLVFDSRIEKRWTAQRDKIFSRNSKGEIVIYKQSSQNSFAEAAPKLLETIELNPQPTIPAEFGRTTDASPDGKFLVFGQSNGLVQLYNTDTGAQLRAFNAHSGFITDIQFSPDGTLLATTASDRTIKVWEVASGRNLYTLRGIGTGIVYNFNLATWLADSQTLLVNSQAGAFLWKLKN